MALFYTLVPYYQFAACVSTGLFSTITPCKLRRLLEHIYLYTYYSTIPLLCGDFSPFLCSHHINQLAYFDEASHRTPLQYPLDLLNKNNSSQVQFWSPTKVLKTCKCLDEIETEKADKIAQTQETKLQWKLQKKQAARDVEKRQIEQKNAHKKTQKQQEAEKIKCTRQREAQHVACEEKKTLQLAEKEK
ncbi:conserved hypothetical protein [Coccidioides posadasii str. Silveira]|uniref:Uncharacterized protein n=1 Tax=Coccidioides posadasii (strain RMSCC 757 / Silveira) TaxID=443226 RepID=E9D5A1_COCPS|nr:conserved hypothetical protein [Coccidioides posadasii str. Silveira]